MSLTLRTMLLICATSAAWAFSFGLGSQVVTHWMSGLQQSNTVIGLCHSFYYFGLAVGSCAIPWLNRRLGPVWCAAIGMLGAGVTLRVFPWADDVWFWYVLRFVNGWAGAMTVVPLETMVSRGSHATKRTQNFAFYGVAITIGGAAGIAVGLHLCGPGDAFPFTFGGGVPVVFSLLLAGLPGQPTPMADAHHERASPDQPVWNVVKDWQRVLALGRNSLSYGTAWCQGFLEGGMLAFLSLFLVDRGFSRDEAGTLMSVTLIGVILFQVPLAWLADRLGRTPILLGCYGVVVVALISIPWLSHWLVLAAVLFAFGACTGAMYPLGLAMLGETTPEAGLARAYAWYLAIECVGSQLGAAAMGKARDEWGDTSMFAVGLAAVALVLLLWGVLRGIMKKEVLLPEASSAEKPNERRAA